MQINFIYTLKELYEITNHPQVSTQRLQSTQEGVVAHFEKGCLKIKLYMTLMLKSQL